MNTNRVLHFETIDSTNEEALRQLEAGCDLPLWIVAGEQTRGRGRGGRHWHSPKGNLYTTLVLQTPVSAAVATQLSFVAGLAAYDAAARFITPTQLQTLCLKWPNDLMLDGGKLAGVLLESVAAPKGRGLSVIIGIGINAGEIPKGLAHPTASLGLGPEALGQVFEALSATLKAWLSEWDEGKGFERIREAWLSRALGLNQTIGVNLNGSAIRGKFRGVDADGALQLETAPGVVILVTAGDIYPESMGG